MIYSVFLLTLICFAGFYTWTKCLTGVILAIGIMKYAMDGRRKLRLPLISPLLFCLITVLVSFWAIDRSRNLEGIITAFVILESFVFFSVCSQEEKEKMVNIIPIFSAVMIVVSLLAFAIPGLPLQLWQADRMGGIFQYSNTCALYYLISIVIEAVTERKNRYLHYGLLALLILGILLTGSRSIVLLLIVWGIYQFFAFTGQRKALTVIGGVTVIVVIVAALFLNNTQNIGRLTTIIESNSTVWGRILYNLDGLKMLIHHPFGMGYLGYYFVQGSAQTGVYTTMFVHNDLLQMGLDYGIIAMLLFMAFIINQLIRGKSSRLAKTLIIIIVVASLADFHLQYISIVMILIMCFDMECELPYIDRLLANFGDNREKAAIKKKSVNKKPDNTTAIILTSAVVLVCAYFTIAFGCLVSDNTQAVLKMLPSNTEALEKELDKVATAEETEVLASKILRINKYSVKAWRYKAYADAAKADYNSALECIDRALCLDRYNLTLYRAFDALLEDMAIASATVDRSVADRLTEMKNSLPERLTYLAKETSPLAYKLKDKPEFVY